MLTISQKAFIAHIVTIFIFLQPFFFILKVVELLNTRWLYIFSPMWILAVTWSAFVFINTVNASAKSYKRLQFQS